MWIGTASDRPRGRLAPGRTGGSASILAAVLAIASVTAFASVADADDARTTEPGDGGRAELFTADDDGVPGAYIVVLEDRPVGLDRAADRVDDTIRSAERAGGDVVRRYGTALSGFAVEGMSAPAIDTLRSNPAVDYIVQDSVVSIADEQVDPPWGLDRIDQVPPTGDGLFHFTRTGAGVDAFILDTGIFAGHDEFGGRVAAGFSAVGGGTDDCNGHGTHVAGTVGGATYGVAKHVRLRPVRVLDCNGTGFSSLLVAGLDWVAQTATGPSVANMSIGMTDVDPAIDQALATLVSSGVTVVVSAGNDAADACGRSPASAPPAIAVAASDPDDRRGWFSNDGPCVDVWAPGVDVLSAWIDAPDAARFSSGTSMAAPHVAGVAATYLESNPTATPAQVTDAILGSATPVPIADSSPGSPGLMLNSALTDPPQPFSCSASAGQLWWTDAGAPTYFVHAVAAGRSQYLGGHATTTLAVPAADSFRVVYWTGPVQTAAECDGPGVEPFGCSTSFSTLSWTDVGADRYHLRRQLGGLDTYLGSVTGTALPIPSQYGTYEVIAYVDGRQSTSCTGPSGATLPAFTCTVHPGEMTWTDQDVATYYVRLALDGEPSRYLGASTFTGFEVDADYGVFSVIAYTALGRREATCTAPGGAGAPAFVCSTNGATNTLNWTAQDVDAYFVRHAIGGADRYVGSTTSLSHPIDEQYGLYTVVAYPPAGRRTATCAAPGGAVAP